MNLVLDKVKKFFFPDGKLKKTAVFAVLFCLFLGLTLPFQFAQAQGGILGALMAIPINIISVLLQVLLAVSNLIVGLAGLILNWVLSPYFMSLPYTYGGIVEIGWPIVRDFINMFFIIALVIIGLATALRIREYEAQKTLPVLIIIAILINFTPVICGAIVDGQNILMNFFLEEITGFQLMGNFFATQGTMLWETLIHFFDIRYATSLLAKTIGMIAFDWMAAFIFLLYSLLFIARYVMIWVLVIVSPIAFFSRIFPSGQKYLFKSILGWDEWWKQFIEWSLIGIIGAFFIYLAEQLLIKAPAFIPGIPPGGGWGWITIPVVEFINNLLPYGVVLVFLLLGFFTATSTSAMGANAIINFAKTGGAAAGRGAARVAKIGGAALATRYLGKPAERIAGRLERVTAPWAAEKGLKGVVSKALAPGAAITRYAGAQLRRAPAVLKERMAGWIGEQEKGAAGKSAETQAAEFNEAYVRATTTGIGWEKAVGVLRAGIKDGNLGDIQTALGLGDEEMKAMTKKTAIEAAKYGKQKEILQTGLLKDRDIRDVISGARLSDAEQDIYGLKLSEAEKEKYQGSVYRKVMAGIKPGDIPHLSKSVVTNKEGGYPEAADAIHEFWSGPQVGEAARNFGSAFVDSFMEEAKKRESAQPGWYTINNPKIPRYFRGTAARDLGFDPGIFQVPPTGWTHPDGSTNGPPPRWRPGNPIPRGWTPPTAERERLAPELELADRIARAREIEERITEEVSLAPPEPPFYKRRERYEDLRKRGPLRSAEEQREFKVLEREVKPVLDELNTLKGRAINELQRYRHLKRQGGLRSAEEQLEFTRLLPELKRRARRIKEIGGMIREPELETWAEEELAAKIAREREILPLSELESKANEIKIDIENLSNEYKALKKAKPPGFEERAERYKTHLTELRTQLKDIKSNIKKFKKESRSK